jgi:hypothetical protein
MTDGPTKGAGMLERIDMRGRVTLQLSDHHGQVVVLRRRGNRIVSSGRLLVAQLFGGVTAGTPPTKVSHVAVGTDGTEPSDDDTALLAQRAPRKPIVEVDYNPFEEPVPGGAEVVKRTRVSLTAVFDFGEANGAQPLREAGVFSDATGGVMYNRVTFDPVTKTDAFKLTVLWDVVF